MLNAIRKRPGKSAKDYGYDFPQLDPDTIAAVITMLFNKKIVPLRREKQGSYKYWLDESYKIPKSSRPIRPVPNRLGPLTGWEFCILYLLGERPHRWEDIKTYAWRCGYFPDRRKLTELRWSGYLECDRHTGRYSITPLGVKTLERAEKHAKRKRLVITMPEIGND